MHTKADRLVGQPLCPDCYDCTGRVLWHARNFCRAVAMSAPPGSLGRGR
ncbi:hypothetical protein [Streptomyces sp. NPDC048639]